ncbi:Alpha/Beta hydrolase protein [Lasiosphaeria miniovina]|uniref:Carboxylic ester hydrolase n=1 Tax=Lasiosphaeria miniovina TaxID=1954250 RepID=A0AA40DMJ9_9PEZI|nr:Alpha/Beta hydrolase protein [Lasiosphaeria miniovina]KAK0709204.1 Alpha/Beta hydrolase protein [Lasiosphaeria miniovina]
MSVIMAQLWSPTIDLPPLTVDLGYGLYTGVRNLSSALDVWKGIRYAMPPLGQLRWQAPKPPATNRSLALANAFGPACPQALPSVPGALFIPGNEDCLFLNVYAPRNQSANSSLPVLVVIHGGGYGLGDGSQDLSSFINTNGNALVAVSIQYRLGAFGFLASPEIKSRGVLNAGLLDQRFALEWVRSHIGKFGGDPDRVTVAGESAGGGSVLMHATAQNGTLGTQLFKNLIAASPWIPTQPYHNDAVTVNHYYTFSSLTGCSAPARGSVFDCLVSRDSLLLQYAANLVSTNAPTPHGNWAFIPVTDGSYVTGPPSSQLGQRQINGCRLLVGNNSNEGSLIPPSNIVTQDDLIAWLKSNFPNLSDRNVTNILAVYPSSRGPVDPSSARYDTDGYGPGTAVNISQVATGQQQRCYNIYAEASVICPSYWFATAFTGQGREAYHYQYSVPFAVHGSDIAAYYGPPTDNQGPDFVTAFRKIYGNFIINDNPSITNIDANGLSSVNPTKPNPASNWPLWSQDAPVLVNLNETGGTAYTAISPLGIPVTQFRGPGMFNNITLADAYQWEGGRGRRCDFWRDLSPFVPQ